jgi:hypothetical protein
MSCCGQGRAALRQMQLSVEPVPVVADKTVTRVLLHYKAQTPITVRGVHTGKIYSFDGERSRQHVELRDAQALLRSRSFVQVD